VPRGKTADADPELTAARRKVFVVMERPAEEKRKDLEVGSAETEPAREVGIDGQAHKEKRTTV
jgi:hypothetical protein